MVSLQIENVSVWTNKYNGSAKLHLKEKSDSNLTKGYIFLTQKEAASFENELDVALSGEFSEIEIRSGTVPITLYVAEDKFSLVHGGEKAG